MCSDLDFSVKDVFHLTRNFSDCITNYIFQLRPTKKKKTEKETAAQHQQK